MNTGQQIKENRNEAITGPNSTSRNNFSSALWALFTSSFNCPTYVKCLMKVMSHYILAHMKKCLKKTQNY